MTRVFRMMLVACVAMPLGACTTVAAAPPEATPSTAEGHDYQLRPGQEVSLGEAGRLRYQRMVNDSRCAPDVQCVWAGDAEVAFAWTPADGASRSFSLHTGVDPRQQSLGAYRVVLVSLDRGRAPQATVRLDPASP
ncbi:MAG: hypothetical protein ACJ8GK_05655 [Luteimonas sp.]